jgi:hypothetical protein
MTDKKYKAFRNLGDMFGEYIEEWVQLTLKEYEGIPEAPEYVATDSIGEVMEKLVILHIRTWMLEDAIQIATTDAKIADLKRKIDICFKVKRPKLVEAINRMMEDAVVNGRSLHEDSVKHYKGIDNA